MITTPAVLELNFRPHAHAKVSIRRLFTALFLTAGILSLGMVIAFQVMIVMQSSGESQSGLLGAIQWVGFVLALWVGAMLGLMGIPVVADMECTTQRPCGGAANRFPRTVVLVADGTGLLPAVAGSGCRHHRRQGAQIRGS